MFYTSSERKCVITSMDKKQVHCVQCVVYSYYTSHQLAGMSGKYNIFFSKILVNIEYSVEKINQPLF